jgi:hypothetical protein
LGFTLLLATTAYALWIKRRSSFSTVLVAVLTLVVIAPIAQHRIFQVLYPLDRAALYFFPLAAIAMFFFLHERQYIRRPFTRACTVIVIAAMVVHIALTANVTQTYLWPYDRDTRSAMLDIGRHFKATGQSHEVNLGNFWAFEPAMNYYRKQLQYDWLTPATRDPVILESHDVVYCYTEELTGQPGNYEILERYPAVGTVLIRVKHLSE